MKPVYIKAYNAKNKVVAKLDLMKALKNCKNTYEKAMENKMFWTPMTNWLMNKMLMGNKKRGAVYCVIE